MADEKAPKDVWSHPVVKHSEKTLMMVGLIAGTIAAVNVAVPVVIGVLGYVTINGILWAGITLNLLVVPLFTYLAYRIPSILSDWQPTYLIAFSFMANLTNTIYLAKAGQGKSEFATLLKSSFAKPGSYCWSQHFVNLRSSRRGPAPLRAMAKLDQPSDIAEPGSVLQRCGWLIYPERPLRQRARIFA